MALRVEDVSLAERTIAVQSGKGGKRCEIPIRAEFARLLAMHTSETDVRDRWSSAGRGHAEALAHTLHQRPNEEDRQ